MNRLPGRMVSSASLTTRMDSCAATRFRLRFWGVNYSFNRDVDLKELGHSARFLAKRGVNIIRFGDNLQSQAKNPELTDTDPKRIDHVWQIVAAMKNAGIYTTISPYWSGLLKHVPRSWGIEGWPENQSPAGLLFFNEQLQTGYKAWLKALLVPRNPYTGVSLAQDPALAMILIQNEDSLLFWSEQSIKGKQLELLGRQFAEWAKLKYGTLEVALREWSGAGMPEDAPARGILGIHIVWQFTQSRTGGIKKRLDDQLQFLAETMYRFNKEITRYLREDLGCKQLIIAGNWKTADSVRLNDAERWSYTADDVLAVNRYYAPPHLGPDRGWRINKGDRFQNLSVLFNPGAFPLAVKQVAGYPMFVLETGWVPPLGYQSESPFLAAGYQSLTGVDRAFFVSITASPSGRTGTAVYGIQRRAKSGPPPRPWSLASSRPRHFCSAGVTSRWAAPWSRNTARSRSSGSGFHPSLPRSLASTPIATREIRQSSRRMQVPCTHSRSSSVPLKPSLGQTRPRPRSWIWTATSTVKRRWYVPSPASLFGIMAADCAPLTPLNLQAPPGCSSRSGRSSCAT